MGLSKSTGKAMVVFQNSINTNGNQLPNGFSQIPTFNIILPDFLNWSMAVGEEFLVIDKNDDLHESHEVERRCLVLCST